ncbi:jnk1/mapk8-associated membrane protein [Anaeramoeba flamelloides]|uniref:Jnk1/mapk8-associated membrane protein n=1 Tax=Anaeramoeba flamelloides TaxID=1746091 RepID=A0AAV7ZQW8_9EUKA|nr:jnk1/mapk8-associated membrane protein [Anaeramoeba flamelloides]KAJ6226554.1 jnk1/mapk8-associated membrane protein [Anaeramoeba flamelloides]
MSSRLLFCLILLFFCTQICCDEIYQTEDDRTRYQATHSRCLGRYCGRKYEDKMVTTEVCGKCERGSKTDGWVCLPCEDVPTRYEWCYLIFVFMLPCGINGSIIILTSKIMKDRIVLIISSFFEAAIAFLFTLLSFNPKGNLKIYTCNVDQFSDWFPTFYNPPNYHCSSEKVYPFWTFFLLFYLYLLGLILLFRFILKKVFQLQSMTTLMLRTLHPIPFLLILQVLFGGLIYYFFPYLLLFIGACLDLYFHITNNLISTINITTYFFRYSLLFFSLFSITQQYDLTDNLYLIFDFVAPLLFAGYYYLTKPLTKPEKWMD